MILIVHLLVIIRNNEITKLRSVFEHEVLRRILETVREEAGWLTKVTKENIKNSHASSNTWSFLYVSPTTAALSYRKPASAGTSRVSCGVGKAAIKETPCIITESESQIRWEVHVTDNMIKCICKTSRTNQKSRHTSADIRMNTRTVKVKSCSCPRHYGNVGGVEVWRHLPLTSAIKGEGRGFDSRLCREFSLA